MSSNSSLNSLPSDLDSLLDNSVFRLLFSSIFTLFMYSPNIYLFVSTGVQIRKSAASKGVLLKLCLFFVFTGLFKLGSSTIKSANSSLDIIRIIGTFILAFTPNSIIDRMVEIVVSVRSYLLKLHPFVLYSNYKHRAALRKIQQSMMYIQKNIRVLADQEKKEIRDRLLESIFEQYPKTYNEEGVQCQIISVRAPEVKTYKPAETTQSQSSILYKPLTKVVNPPSSGKATDYQIQKKQEYKKESIVERTPVSTKYITPIRTPLTESISFKRSDVLVTEQTPPKHMRTSTPVYPSITQLKKPDPKPQLGQKFNLSISQYSDLLQEEQEPYQSNRTPQPIPPKFQKPTKISSPKGNKRFLTKTQIYMRSIADPSKLQKMYLSLYEGDEIQLITVNNTVLQVMILLKLIDLKNGYYEARGYSSVSGMCTKTLMFKGDHSEFNKYIEK